MDAGKDVQFDWDGSLELARKLWAYADDLATAKSTRSGQADTALTKWEGPYGDQFKTRKANEQSSMTSIIAGLRQEAEGWAQAWKMAMDQQNRVLRARAVNEHQDSKNIFEKGWDKLTGDDDLPPEPTPVPLPTAPGFAKTADFYRA